MRSKAWPYKKSISQNGPSRETLTYPELVLAVDVRLLQALGQELLVAVGAGVDEVVVGGVAFGEVSPDVSHGAPAFLKNSYYVWIKK